MLIVSEIENNLDVYIIGLEKRGLANGAKLLNEILEKDRKRKALQGELDTLFHKSNIISKEIGMLFKQGKKEEAEKARANTSKLKEQSKKLSIQLHAKEEELKVLLYNIPNIPHESVPKGKTEEDNEVVKVHDEKILDPEGIKVPHWELIETYDIIDFEKGNKVSGSGFPFYKGQGARLIRGLINYFLDKATEAGYSEVQPPIMINEASGYGTGQLPDKEGQMYHMAADDLYMIPTAEVPITNMYRDEIMPQEMLPIKNAGHTPCFRREAGSWGTHVRGLNRLHQFDKVEIVQIVEPAKSYQVLDEMVAHIESLIKSLELPYRISRLCSGDLGFTSALTYDFEVFSAAQERWLEVSSVSNFETYQANRLKLRIRNNKGKKELAHTLNGSALALPRIVAALLENNQEADLIRMPKVLHSYLGFSAITK